LSDYPKGWELDPHVLYPRPPKAIGDYTDIMEKRVGAGDAGGEQQVEYRSRRMADWAMEIFLLGEIFESERNALQLVHDRERADLESRHAAEKLALKLRFETREAMLSGLIDRFGLENDKADQSEPGSSHVDPVSHMRVAGPRKLTPRELAEREAHVRVWAESEAKGVFIPWG
jgi:hypothetical protein